jgi:hypothetical protein
VAPQTAEDGPSPLAPDGDGGLRVRKKERPPKRAASISKTGGSSGRGGAKLHRLSPGDVSKPEEADQHHRPGRRLGSADRRGSVAQALDERLGVQRRVQGVPNDERQGIRAAGNDGSAIRNNGAPVFDQHTSQRRRLVRCAVDSTIGRIPCVHHIRIVDVDRISIRERDIRPIEKQAKAVDEIADVARVFSRGEHGVEEDVIRIGTGDKGNVEFCDVVKVAGRRNLTEQVCLARRGWNSIRDRVILNKRPRRAVCGRVAIADDNAATLEAIIVRARGRENACGSVDAIAIGAQRFSGNRDAACATVVSALAKSVASVLSMVVSVPA